MQEVITIENGKGGSGKTPTGVHIFYALGRRNGGKYLFIDADPQATGSFHLIGAKYKYQEPTFYDAIKDLKRVEPIQVEGKERLFVLPCHDGLSAAEDELTKNPAKPFQWRIKNLLKLYSEFGVVIIDTPGSHISIFPIMALTASTKVIVPVKTEIAHQQATIDSMNLIEDVRENLNPNLIVWGLFPNQFELKNRHHKEALELIYDMQDPQGNPYPVYPRPSLKRTRYNDATGMHVDVREFVDCVELGAYWDEVADALLTRKIAGGGIAV